MVRFGAFELDVQARRLRRDGADVHLSPKEFDLLALLLDAAPRVLPKRELHDRLWPGGTVTDSTLVALVKQLRAALQDHDRKSPLIRTVHRVGYALECPPAARQSANAGATARWLVAGQRKLPLVAGENIVGRDAAAQVRLNDPVVSRRHARILVSSEGAVVEDLHSKNGTFVEGQRVAATAVPLPDGGQVRFGTLIVTYRESGGGMPTLTHLVIE